MSVVIGDGLVLNPQKRGTCQFTKSIALDIVTEFRYSLRPFVFVLKSSHCSALQSDWLILENGGVFIYENCSSARNASRLKVGL